MIRLLLITLLVLIAPSLQAELSPLEKLKLFPILDRGRVKPLNTFARESAYEITGKENPFGMSGVEFFLSLLDNPDKVTDRPIIKIQNHDLLKEFALPLNQKYYSYNSFTKAPGLEKLFSEVRQKASMKKKLTPRDEAVRSLENAIHLISGIIQGESLFLIPPKDGGANWQPLSRMMGYSMEEQQAYIEAFGKILAGYHQNQGTTLTEGIQSFTELRQQFFTIDSDMQSRFEQEILYLDFKPYRKSAIFYALSVLFILFFLQTSNPIMKTLSQCSFWVALVLHTWALGLRVYILERPPVSNMYESVVFMAWASGVIFLITQAKKFNSWYHLAASVTGALTLILADLLPMDSSLGVLEAVLRSNYWLIIHVMTIVSSYGAFTLSAILAHLYLILRVTRPAHEALSNLHGLILNSIRVGALLLVVGIILGGIWANESWGRFWGWDPKETWSLIAFLCYMALLHARKNGKIRQDGTVLWSLICYLMILMTWYGVNYIIGAGLHSYGFGSGGTHWFWSFVAFEVLLASYLGLQFKRKQKHG